MNKQHDIAVRQLIFNIAKVLNFCKMNYIDTLANISLL